MVQQSRYPGPNRSTPEQGGFSEPLREEGDVELPMRRLESPGAEEVRRPGRSGQILVVDDDGDARSLLAVILRDAGFEVEEAADGPAALQSMERQLPAAVLADLRMPGLDGLQLLEAVRRRGFGGGFVVLTAHASVETAVEAMRRGADDFLRKPIQPDSAVKLVQRVAGTTRGSGEGALRSEGEDPISAIVGQTPAWQQLLEVVRRAAPTPATVLILGESGTGKELIARAVHQLSPRRAAPLVAVNCAALPESLVEAELFGFERGAFTGATMRRAGRFERAQGGTLFLDEIGELAPAVQVKLLRALQHREFERIGGTETLHADVRVVAATNRDLAAEMRAGRFREDLFYRLNVLTLVVPPLRERRDDVPLLAEHFVRRFAGVYGRPVHTIAPRAMQALARHAWPGNVRELENAIEHAVVLAPGPELRLEDLPAPLGSRTTAARPESPAAQSTLYEIEREAILRALRLTGGSTGRAARMLGISARKIQYKLKEYAAAPVQTAEQVLEVDPTGDAPDLGEL